MSRTLTLALVLFATVASHARASEPVFRGELASHVSGHVHSGFPIDSLGTSLDGVTALESRTRIRVEMGTNDFFSILRMRLGIGGDLGAGTWAGRPTLEGDDLPGAEHSPALLTELWTQIDLGPWIGFKGGLMLSDWGLGLVAGGGDDLLNGRIRDRLFETARPGDRLIRWAVFSKPFASLEDSALRGLVLAAAMDRVEEDDTSSHQGGDETTQGVGSARLFLSKDEWFGLYYVYRDQTTDAGKRVEAHVVDLAGDLRFDLGCDHELRVQLEVAGIFGETDVAPSPEHPTHEILQLGALTRLQWRQPHWPFWAELDLGYFSGDSNLDDGRLTRFVSDRNLQQGMVLFPTVLAWHTGRQRISVDRPEVIGYPPEDLDRLATDGGVTSAITLYPKGVWTPTSWLDVYGGLLVAFASEHLPDPYTTRTLGGGAPRNATGEAPTSSLLGVEVDLGVRGRFDVPNIDLSVFLSTEYGVLVPGGALVGLDPVHAVRISLAMTGGIEAEGSE